MEKMLLKTSSKHMNSKVISNCQHGFMKGQLHFVKLIAFCNEATNLVDKGKTVDVVYLNSKILALSSTACS